MKSQPPSQGVVMGCNLQWDATQLQWSLQYKVAMPRFESSHSVYLPLFSHMLFFFSFLFQVFNNFAVDRHIRLMVNLFIFGHRCISNELKNALSITHWWYAVFKPFPYLLYININKTNFGRLCFEVTFYIGILLCRKY